MNFKYILCLGMLFTISVSFSQNLSIYKSKKGVEETTQALVRLIKERNLVFLETVSRDKIAKEKGIDIEPTNVVIFEDSELTSKLITCQQTTALDLPLKILIWEENEDVYIGFNNPLDMEKRYMLNDCHDTIESLSRLMIRLVTDVMRAM
ncbi:MAG: DUF302 domain-containing protein [Cyclobacteriaceae bacterium]|nr:DUF302 domain-containing protein [Cyclobacteriaceae bacterium SS2]